MKSNLSIVLVLVAPLLAQSTVKDALTQHWKTSAEFSSAVANTMPAESYNFRPNPEEMSFGQLMAHIAGINEYACAIASGLPRPTLPPKIVEWSKDTEKVDVSKETAMPFLKESFEFCNKAVAAMTPARLDTVVGPAARNLTGSLRANMDETDLLVVITEQGENRNPREEQRNIFGHSSFPHGFARRCAT